MNDQDREPLTIEFTSESVDSGNNHQYSDDKELGGEVRKEQTTLSVIGLILALPFPILIVILWVTLAGIKASQQSLGEGAMNAVFLYLLQFFVVPVTSIASIIIAFIVTTKSRRTARKIGYISLGITALGFIILGLFLNNT